MSHRPLTIPDARPRSGPLTRSQLRAQAASPDPALIDDTSASDAGDSITSISPEPDDDVVEAGTRTTRSGRAFGVMQSRKNRLRQEAIDDPDMAAEDEVEEDEEDGEDDEETFEAGQC